MAQYDLLIIQNTAAAGIDYEEKTINMGKGDLLSAIATTKVPTVLAAGTNGYILSRDDAEVTGLKWIAQAGGHTQNTDTGTTSTVFEMDSDGYKIEITAESAAKLGIKVDGGATYADLQVKDLVVNDLTVNGTSTIINSTTITVDDKNIELGSVASPTDITADGGGITLKGDTDKTILWDNANDNWTLNQNVNIPTGSVYKINNVPLNQDNFADGTTNKAYTATEKTKLALFQVAAPVAKNSAGTTGQTAYDANYFYQCVNTNTWRRTALAWW